MRNFDPQGDAEDRLEALEGFVHRRDYLILYNGILSILAFALAVASFFR